MRKIAVVAFVDADAVPLPPADERARLAGLLERLARERIMLVFCSHRTRAQVESTRQAFGIFHPFLAENGGAAFVPERYFGTEIENTRKVGGYHAVEFAAPYDAVVDTLRRAAERLNLGVLGFSDMSVEQVARECGMSLLDARRAKLREYSEPFRLLSANPIAERRLLKTLEGAGLTCLRNPDFHVVSGTKGPHAGLALLASLYRAAFGSVLTVASVDGEGAAALAPHVNVALRPIELDQADPRAGLTWLERIVDESDSVRGGASVSRAARVAR